MADPIRDALVAVVQRYKDGADPDAVDLGEREIGAQAVLDAYDEAKLAHGDTTLETTKRVRRPGGKKK